ncbi:MAG TPA: BrnT family toxin [Hyphomicrobiales bacterium]|nr:BrnT family toxin [Hyphomicrobiales bacterium]
MGDGGTPDGFEWDPVKAATNLEKHGVPFDLAAKAFLDERRLDYEDDRLDYGEERRVVIGAIQGRLHTVVYVMRGESCRIISARIANARERFTYGHREI